MTYLEFETLCSYCKAGKDWIREGQNLFTVLYYCKPNLYGTIAGTHLDPFSVDSRLPACRAWLQEHWEDQNATI